MSDTMRLYAMFDARRRYFRYALIAMMLQMLPARLLLYHAMLFFFFFSRFTFSAMRLLPEIMIPMLLALISFTAMLICRAR